MLRRAQRVLLGVYRLLPRNLRRVVVRSFAPSFTVGAICVVERPDGRLLVVRHSYRRRWGFPGGLVKRHEAIEDAARREAREEVGVDIGLVDEPAVVVAPAPRRVDVVFRARVAEGFDPDSLRPMSPEIVEVRWVERHDLPELQEEAADALMALARRTASG
jgi:8-oxo-dGTP diphosphatase